MALKIRITVALMAVVILGIISGSFLFNEDSLLTFAKAENVKTVILDAGHGGFDGGAVALDGTVEKDINLSIALSLKDMLERSGYYVIMTREEDTSTESDSGEKLASRKKSDLKNRLEIMSDYPQSIFVSVHLNKFTTSAARGSQVFYSGNDNESKVLGDFIQNSIIKLLQPDNYRVNKKATSSTYILHNAKVPAVLVECGFLSNPQELEKLKNSEYQKQMAFCIYCGIAEYYTNETEI